MVCGHAGLVTVLQWTADLPSLRSPILVTAFEGLFDVGGAATGAIESLRGTGGIEVGVIDADPFFDFSERRPEIRIADDGRRVIDWPDHRIHVLALPDQSRDLVLVEGVEPHLLWRTFSDAITEVATAVDAAMVVTFGAMIAEVPHTRPPTITGSTTDADLAAVMRLDRPSYQGPTGVIGVLHDPSPWAPAGMTRGSGGSGRGLEFAQTPGQAALPSSCGVPVNGAGAGDAIEDRLDLAILRLGGRDVLGLDGREERLDLGLHATLPPVVEGATLRALADSLLG